MTEKDPFFHIPANKEWNALVGKQGERLSYAEGYLEAALELSKQIILQKLYGQRDTLAMPILYNARHAIELHLKMFIDELFSVGLLKTSHRANHDIASQFSHLHQAQIPDATVVSLLDKLKPFVDSLSRIDGDGQEFRYFENREGDRSLKDKALVNIEVIRSSLDNLKGILSELKYRTWSLCDEFRTGTHTTRLSRQDLFNIAEMLPLRSDWRDPKFDGVKAAVMERFGIGSRQFSIALKKMQETREFKATLGLETKLVYLSDEKAVFLVDQWKIIHPPREKSKLGIVSLGSQMLERLFENDEKEKAAMKKIAAKLNANEIADAKAIFYLARNNQFSEYYEMALERTIKEIEARNAIHQVIYDLMQKTNFLMMFETGLRKLGRLELADRLSSI